MSIATTDRRRLLVTSIAAIALASIPSLYAASAEAPADQGEKLEEIVVTAQKRTENLQQVPISAQVIGNQALVEQNQNSLESLAQIVPGLHINTGGFGNALTIRGVGDNGGGDYNFDQSVATFVDDIYHGRSRTSDATFLDLDRIEVLKGPQSTFFGNNAIAGALNIVTKKPGDNFDSTVRLLYGMYGQYAAEAGVSLPINDMLSVRVAGIFDGGSGWIKNVSTGDEAPDVTNKAGRITVRFRPTEDLEATMKIEGSQNRTTGTAFGQPEQWANCPPPAPLPPNYGAPGSNCALAVTLHVPIGLDNNENSGLPGQGNSLSTFEDVLTINYHQWNHDFTSVTGFNNYHYDNNIDTGTLPEFLLTQHVPEKYHQISQELRVASATGQPLEYLAGAYFQSDHLDANEVLNAPFLNVLGPIIGIPADDLPVSINDPLSQGERIYSLFGSLSWNMTDRLKLNAGLRESWVKKNAVTSLDYGTATSTYGGYVPLPTALEPKWSLILGPPGTESLNLSESAFMPSGGLQYQVDPRAMIYFSYSRGFLGGGFNAGQQLNSENKEFGPEHVNAYELGLKSKWFDDRMLFNIDVFRSEYAGLQVRTLVDNPATNTFSTSVRNAADSLSEGVEFEAQWALTEALRLSANATYLDSHYVSFTAASPTTLQTFCSSNYVLPYCSVYPDPVPPVADLSGQQTNYAPRWSGSLSASYTIVLPTGFKLTTAINPYVTSSYNEQQAPYQLGTGGYVRLDSRLTLTSPDSRWAVDLIGKNLTDRIIVVLGDAKEEPRNVALQFRYKWGHF